ncbi:hypothetical protein BCI9360_03595 [Bacillus sp. CECT 9360]|nr:hypothetical protein BCI9360_03595 [Bacillus sp. CECT 9360]
MIFSKENPSNQNFSYKIQPGYKNGFPATKVYVPATK